MQIRYSFSPYQHIHSPSQGRARLDLFAGLLLLIFISLPHTACANDSLESVTLQLKWQHGFQFAGYYAALENGYYQEAGLEVTIREHEVNRSPIEVMLDNHAQYAVTGTDIILYQAKGNPVVALATFFQHSPYAFLVRADSGIKRIEDFAGKRIVLSSDTQDAAAHAALRRAGINEGDYIPQPTSFDVHSLIRNETDVYYTNVTVQGYTLQEAGIEAHYILPRQYGVDFYGDILATTATEVTNNPKRVQAFREATIKGWRYALQHPDEIIDLVMEKYTPQGRSRANLQYEASASPELIQPLLVDIGYMNPARWKHISNIFMELGLIDSDSTLDDLIYHQPYEMDNWAHWIVDNRATIAFTITILIIFILMLLIFQMRRIIQQRTADLSESEQHMRSLVNAAPACIVTMDQNANLLSINAAGLNLLQADNLEQAREVCLFTEIDAEYQEAFHELNRQVFEGKQGSLVFSTKGLKGRKLWLETHAVPFRNAAGQITAQLGITLDITERIEAEEIIRSSEQRFRELAELLPEAIFEADINLKLTYANKRAVDMFGYTEEDIKQGLNGLDCYAPQERARARQNITRRIHGENLGTVEYLAQAKDGTTFPIILNASPIRNNHQLTGFRVIVLDITDRKQTEQALRRSQKMDAIGQLTGGISHDFNNILNILLGNLELLKKQIPDDKKLQQRLASIEKPARRAADLTRQLLSFSRHHAEQASITNINQLIEEMQSLITHSITPQIEIQYHLSMKLWSTEINAGDFDDALLNLVLNARDAMHGNGQLVIETENKTLNKQYCKINPEAKPGDYVLLTVSDNGEGMSAEQLEHIFEPFYTTKEYSEGTGLGLSMVFGFTQRSSGHIKAYSTPGTGTTFRLYLPRAKVATKTAQTPVKQEDIELPRGKETILVVDDEIGLLELAEESLQELGYHVVTAGDARQALQVMEQEPHIDILISDVIMPGGINGYELAERATSYYPNLKVLLASGYTQKDTAANSQKHFNANMLTKPYSQSELAQRVREMLET